MLQIKSPKIIDILNITIPISDYSVFVPSFHKLQVVWLPMYLSLYCFHLHVSQLHPHTGGLNQHEVNSAQQMQSDLQVWIVCAAKMDTLSENTKYYKYLKSKAWPVSHFSFPSVTQNSSKWKQIIPHAFLRLFNFLYHQLT